MNTTKTWVTMEMFEPFISIVIPVYNGADHMREAIDSAFDQTYGNLEVLVVNDGSDDGGQTENIALSYGGRIRYFSKPNGGVASALNLGIREMRGEYFSWLSHDDKYFPNKISAQVELLSGMQDKTAVVFSGWAVADAKGRETHRVLPSEKYTAKQLSTPLFALMHGMINGCSLLIHKSHFDRVGVFDESLPTTQDYDLWFRIMKSAQIGCRPEALSMTRVHRGQGSRPSAKAHVWVASGSALVGAAPLDGKPGDTGAVKKFVLSDKSPSVLFIPKGHYNGFMSLEENTKIIFFSTSTLDESKGDDIRQPYDLWDIWREDYR
ncbi:MAG: glycosyltransferase [Oscillospiraceae bacterium]|nr:glycosyltransferase [Oscillospiraceae bacterium]